MTDEFRAGVCLVHEGSYYVTVGCGKAIRVTDAQGHASGSYVPIPRGARVASARQLSTETFMLVNLAQATVEACTRAPLEE